MAEEKYEKPVVRCILMLLGGGWCLYDGIRSVSLYGFWHNLAGIGMLIAGIGLVGCAIALLVIKPKGKKTAEESFKSTEKEYQLNETPLTPEEEKALTITPEELTQGTSVDLGLSVKWASCNIGAANPYNYGDYYAWGETIPKPTYTLDNYKYFEAETGYFKYNGEDELSALLPSDDVAHVKLGGNWRMPTFDELGDLIQKCKVEPRILKGIKGLKITSSNGNSIFLPAAHSGGVGYYWSRERSPLPGSACGLIFNFLLLFRNPELAAGDDPYWWSKILGVGPIGDREWGLCVRAVEENEASLETQNKAGV